MTRFIVLVPTLVSCYVLTIFVEKGAAFHSLCHPIPSSARRKRRRIQTYIFSSSDPEQLSTSSTTGSSRRSFVASSLVSAGVSLLGATNPSLAATTVSAGLPWVQDPINPKRSNVRVEDAESTYNLSFITYLSRFLLSFDPYAQQWWVSKANEIPKSSSQSETFRIRKEQFGEFAASVELGLLDYRGTEGPKLLLEKLLGRYCSDSIIVTNEALGNTTDDDRVKLLKREKREAKRQLALLFGLLGKTQPTKEITQLLASIDNGSISAIVLDQTLNLGGYTATDTPEIQLPPPQAGEAYERATGKAILKPTGKVLRVQVIDGGDGYEKSSSTITIPPPKNGGRAATATAKISNGKMTSILVADPGEGYGDNDVLEFRIDSPKGNGSSTAAVRLVLEQAIVGVELANVGSGYAVEKSLAVSLIGSSGKASLIGTAYPTAETTSFQAYRNPEENQVRNFERKLNGQPVLVGASSGGTLPPTPFGGKASSSQQLLALLPKGFGLEYDDTMGRYVLSMDPAYPQDNPILALQETTTNKRLIPDFGPRGRSPIERDMDLNVDTYLRFCLSGAICSSGVHLALTPLDVTKTKLQTNPGKYPTFASSFQTILNEEGPGTFFTGWLPTVTGNFVAGAVLYALTEGIRRSLTAAAGMDADSLEVPIILAAAGTAAAAAACFYCPFEAVRIRIVAQPDYGPNSVAVVNRMVFEEGIGSLISAIPVFLVKQVPYAMVKFTIFDLSSEYLYRAFPAAQEDIALSLGVSLVCGVLGGVSAAIVSNPADTVISELKKAKSDLTPQEALQALLDRAGIPALFKGLSVRMVFYSLTAALQFMVYDGVRFALGIGPDDLKLYLDVLGGALAEKGTIA